MIKLIKLELRKNNLKPYLLGVLGILFALISMGILFSAIPTLDPSSQEFSNPSMIISLVSIISMSAFAILASIMHSKFVVEEYTGKKNLLLFTYPQKRSTILFAKCVFIFVFTCVSMLTMNMLALLSVGIVSHATGLISQPFTDIGLMLKYSLTFPLVANVIGLIALRIGFYKKSIIVPIVVSTILTALFGNAVMLMGANSVIAFLIVGGILLLISMFLFIGLLKKVNSMECL